MRQTLKQCTLVLTVFSLLFSGLFLLSHAEEAVSRNPLINYSGFLQDAQSVDAFRQERRVPVKAFLTMAQADNTLILDTRSERAYTAKHIKGAVHLNFSDITKDSLAKAIPSKDTRILIYCNNNFSNNTPEFPTKMAPAALNIPTFITLYQYGYRNLYELASVEDETNTVLPFEGSTVSKTLK